MTYKCSSMPALSVRTIVLFLRFGQLIKLELLDRDSQANKGTLPIMNQQFKLLFADRRRRALYQSEGNRKAAPLTNTATAT